MIMTMSSLPGSFALGIWRVLRWVMMFWHFFGLYIHPFVLAMPHYHFHDFFMSSLNKVIAVSFSSMACRWVSFVISRAWTQLVRLSVSIACELSLSCCQTWRNNTLQQCFWSLLPLAVDLKILSHTFPLHYCKCHIFANLWANWLVYMLYVHCSFDTFDWYLQGWHELL